jgi:hypothetical protein
MFFLLQRHQPPTCVAARTGSRTARPIQGQFSVPVAPENSPVSHFYIRKNFEIRLIDRLDIYGRKCCCWCYLQGEGGGDNTSTVLQASWAEDFLVATCGYISGVQPPAAQGKSGSHLRLSNQSHLRHKSNWYLATCGYIAGVQPPAAPCISGSHLRQLGRYTATCGFLQSHLRQDEQREGLFGMRAKV